MVHLAIDSQRVTWHLAWVLLRPMPNLCPMFVTIWLSLHYKTLATALMSVFCLFQIAIDQVSSSIRSAGAQLQRAQSTPSQRQHKTGLYNCHTVNSYQFYQ